MENTKDFITKKMVADGIRQGVIRFQKGPNLEDGPVCAIGDNWFYFGAEYTRPEEYLGTVGFDKAVDAVFEALDEMKDDDMCEYTYYYLYLIEHLSIDFEFKCNELDADKFWRIDAWRPDRPDKDAAVVAYIDDLTGRVVYTDPVFKDEPKLAAIINEKVKEIKEKKVLVAVNSAGAPTLKMKTALGVLTADPDEMDQYNMYIGIEFRDDPELYTDLLAVKVKETPDDKGLHLYVWSDIFNEDWQFDYDITGDDIDELVKQYS